MEISPLRLFVLCIVFLNPQSCGNKVVETISGEKLLGEKLAREREFALERKNSQINVLTFKI
jgi:hypothetical protein